MQDADIQKLKAEFEMYWCSSVQQVVAVRSAKETDMSQEKWARLIGKSVKTIQRFEKYKTYDPELMWLYKKYFL